MKTLSSYFKYVLESNGENDGRRFQSNPNFIFVTYNYEMKKKFTNVAFTAEKADNDVSGVVNITSEELKEMINYLNLNQDEEEALMDQNLLNVVDNQAINELENIKKIKKLIKRLSPYSNELPGTAPYMVQQRNKLLAMISICL